MEPTICKRCSDNCALCSGPDYANCSICSNGYEKIDTEEMCYKKECGNGVINSNEECDDGNTLSRDGCSSRC